MLNLELFSLMYQKMLTRDYVVSITVCVSLSYLYSRSLFMLEGTRYHHNQYKITTYNHTFSDKLDSRLICNAHCARHLFWTNCMISATGQSDVSSVTAPAVEMGVSVAVWCYKFR